MTVSTYSELKTAIGNYQGRADLTDRADEFIDKVEAKFRRRLRLRPMEATATGTFTDGTPTINLPTDFLQVISFTFDVSTNAPRELRYITPSQGDGMELGSDGVPAYYSFVGQLIRLYPTPDDDYAYTLRHYAKFAPLSATNVTNFILTEYPDAYEYGCYAEACSYAGDLNELVKWKTGFEEVIAEIKKSDRVERRPTPIIQIDSALLGNLRSNIETDNY